MSVNTKDIEQLLIGNSDVKKGKLFESLKKKLILDHLSLPISQKLWAQICGLLFSNDHEKFNRESIEVLLKLTRA